MKRAIVILAVLLISSTAIAQLAVTNAAPYNMPAYLVNNVLLGNGVAATNIQFTGNANQLGYFSNGLAGAVNPLGLDSGIVFSSGDVNGIPTGGAGLSTTYGTPGDPDLLTIAQSVNPAITSSQDAATLEFDFVPVGDTVEFRFVFASDEYLTWVNSQYNDIFSFFISGPGFAGPYAAPAGFPNGAENLAVVPGTMTPITISTIHPGLNNQYYINNPGSNTHDFNGYTTVMSIKFHVTCNALFHFKFSISDCSDGSLDTGIFMEGSSFSSNAPVAIDFSTAATGGDSTVIEGCESAILNLTRSDTAGDLTVHYVVGGTATNGVDYISIADSVTYLAGIDTASITITPLLDALVEGQETIIITTSSINACGNLVTSSDSMFIVDVPITTSTTANVNLNCPTDSFEISVAVNGVTDPYSYTWTDTQGNTFYDSSYVFVPALVTDTFFVTATSYCNLITVSDTVIVNVIPWFSLNTIQSDTNICIGDTVNFSTTSNLIAPYTYFWTSNISTLDTPNDSATVGRFNTPGLDTITVTVTDNSGPLTCIRTDTLFVNTTTIPTVAAISNDTVICINGTTTLFANAAGDSAPFNLIWDNGLIGNGPHNVNPTASSTTYSVYVVDANSCVSDTQSVIVDLFDSIAIQTLNPMRLSICEGDTTLLRAFATGGGTNLTYTWLNGNDIIIGTTAINQFTVRPSYDGEIFSVIVSDSCTSPSDTLTVPTDWQDLTLPTYTIDNSVFCYDQFQPTFTNTTITTSVITNVQWDFGDGTIVDLPASAQINHTYSYPGVYYVKLTLTDQAGCQWDSIMDGIKIEAYDNPIADFLWNPNPTDYLNAQITFDNQSTDNVYNQWTFITDAQYTSNDVDPVFQFPQNQPGSYDVTLKVTNSIGCENSITQKVIIDDVFLFYIPTAFTPNGDGLNDTFKVVGEGLDLSSFKMTVFNKWGQLIFQSNNPDNGWDGTHNGNLAPDGVYVWKIDVQEAHAPITHNKEGFISIVK